ncbi:non-ribosomal peptide synthetase [Flavobacterium yafengii]|uniref:non-ribosomal peptide synthetase n=1 Tax=Flavobacterium yafengii TaxID=3041253 RepID=UPI0024A967CA|nr:non-ribosomal peptide synthetase [Flavobacterium yafengii]MDI5888451.1 amino acid adenylation domain-containing protein [Flavobacterium yafengii]
MNKNTVSNNINLVSKYWKKKILNREEVLGVNQKQNSLPCVTINANELNYFNSLTDKNPIAQYTVISAIYSFLLKKLINEFDGYVVSNYKNHHNSLLLSFPIDLKISFKEYLQKTKHEILETLKHSDYNSDLISETRGINNLIILSNYSININSGSKLDCNGILFDVKLNENEDIEIEVTYLEGFVKEKVVECLVQQFRQFVVNLDNNLEIYLSEYSLLSDREKYQLLVDFNDTDVAYPKEKTIIDLFEEQVEKTPNNIAVVFEESRLTYKELNEKVNKLGRYLIETYHIKPDDLIGIKLDRSENMIVAILGILKSGAAYIPIDINYPEERVAYVEEDSNSKLVIDEEELDRFNKVQEKYSLENIGKINQPNDLVYIIYTSGTTGNPKGVMVEHNNIVRLLKTDKALFDFNSNDVWCMFHSYCFDFSVWEMYGALLNGGKVIIIPLKVARDPLAFLLVLKKEKVTVLNQTPSVFYNVLSEDLKNVEANLQLRYVIFGGEALIPRKLRDWNEKYPNTKLVNMYGITETTVHVTYKEITREEIERNISNIGKPIPTLTCYVVDQDRNLVPVGVSGELYVGGEGVARGYLNRDSLTSERFIDSPFKTGERLYRSGDIVRMLENGELEYLGRKDHQIKIRGYRIELGEIESVILEYAEDLNQVVVLVSEVNGEKSLVAYFVSRNIDKSKLRSFLKEKLPEYMIPNFYIELEELPLTPNGKIDRKSLPSVDGADIIRSEYVAPRNEIERSLVGIWQEVLGVEKIGITNNFFELGGHSLIVSQVINRIYKQLGKTVSFKAFFVSPTIAGLSNELQENKYIVIPIAPELESYPLTASQARLWILSQLEGGSLAYNMPAAVKLTGSIEVNKLEESFRLLIDRHEILRTYFKTNEEGDIRQFIVPIEHVDFRISEKNYSSVENQEEVIADYLQEKSNEPFDLEQVPLVRASLIKMKKGEYVFFLSLHHIIGDGWSIKLLISEVVKTYNALRQGKNANLPQLSIQYKDYAVWTNGEKEQEKHRLSEQYWLQQFAGELPVLDLPSFKTRPLIQTYNGDNLTFTYSKEFLNKLKEFSKSHDVTLFMTLMTGINALLHRYTGQDDIIVGTPIAGREHPDLENQMGLYLNTLAIRSRLKEGSSFLDLVTAQKEILLGAYENQSYPFDELIDKLNLKRDTSRSALFDVLVILQNQEQLNNFNNEELISLEVSGYDFKNKTSKFDISLAFTETEGLNLTIEYNTDIYDLCLIERMFSHFENLITQSIEQPEILIKEVDYLTIEEKTQLLVSFNDTKSDYPQDKTIVDLFEDQVARTPNNIAIVFEDVVLTYQELNERSNQLASYLREHYVIEADDLVGIKLERSEWMIITILGVLKSGGAYVPIDPNYPQERIAYIEKDSDSKLVIDESILDRFNEIREKYARENVAKINEAHDLAYVIYTSGTTGNPKGVMVENKSVINLIVSQTIQFNIKETENILQFSNISFDASVEQIFLAVLNGACLSILSKEVMLDSKKLEEFIIVKQITHFHTVPSVLEKLTPGKYPFLKRVISGGDVCSIELASKWHIYNCFYNEYGPTETTVTAIELLYDQNTGFSIGRPISNTKVSILDESLQLVPIGTKGNLYVSGAGVARGYLKKVDLTSEKFISNPFIEGERMYNTGDVGCWLQDGNIEFLGRKDNQVKIRGYRIELGEIESSILLYSEALNQVIVESKVVNGDKVLIAYLVSTNIDKSELRSFLLEKLPDYMVPSFYIELKELPLTPNGKIDRKGLPDVDGEDLIRREYLKPRNEIEECLVSIWEGVLGIEKIGVTDNFFELGGHSLIATRLISLVHKEFKVKISINDLFKNLVLEDQALLIENIQNINKIDINIETEIFYL